MSLNTVESPISIVPGSTPHYLVNTDGNVNSLGTGSLVYNCLTEVQSDTVTVSGLNPNSL